MVVFFCVVGERKGGFFWCLWEREGEEEGGGGGGGAHGGSGLLSYYKAATFPLMFERVDSQFQNINELVVIPKLI